MLAAAAEADAQMGRNKATKFFTYNTKYRPNSQKYGTVAIKLCPITTFQITNQYSEKDCELKSHLFTTQILSEFGTLVVVLNSFSKNFLRQRQTLHKNPKFHLNTPPQPEHQRERERLMQYTKLFFFFPLNIKADSGS